MKNFIGALSIATAISAAIAAPTDVTIMHFQFMPANIVVEVGSTVRWTNMDAIEHSVTSQTGEGTLVPSGVFDHYLNETETFSFTFTTEGTYHYYCVPHGSSMQGTVTVIASEPCIGDFDNDADADSDDVLGFFNAWDNGDTSGDSDDDGDTDSDDIIIFFNSWDSGC